MACPFCWGQGTQIVAASPALPLPGCAVCGEEGLHVCIPEVVRLLTTAPEFQELIADSLREALRKNAAEDDKNKDD